NASPDLMEKIIQFRTAFANMQMPSVGALSARMTARCDNEHWKLRPSQSTQTCAIPCPLSTGRVTSTINKSGRNPSGLVLGEGPATAPPPQDPEHAVDHQPVVLVRPTHLLPVFGCWDSSSGASRAIAHP